MRFNIHHIYHYDQGTILVSGTVQRATPPEKALSGQDLLRAQDTFEELVHQFDYLHLGEATLTQDEGS